MPFITTGVQTLTTDVLVIGAGAAGIRSAAEAASLNADVTLLAKGPVTQAGSTFSDIAKGWGIQALAEKERTTDNLERFYQDVIRVGRGMSDTGLVRILVENSGDCLDELISYGVDFRKDSNGDFLRVKGCFSNDRRAFLTGDFTRLKRSFRRLIRQSEIRTLKGHAIALSVKNNTCHGAWVLNDGNEIYHIRSRATILASGGGGALFHHHFTDNEQTGEGYALADKAGADLTNIEFIQFMLGLKNGKDRLFLQIPDLEESGTLLDEEGKDVFSDILSESHIKKRLIKQRETHLPFSSSEPDCRIDVAIANGRKNGKQVFLKQDHTPEKVHEVVHFAHAFNGGVKINTKAESTVSGLFAAGEVAAGPHGADRIGGCMMTATQVFGKIAGRSAAEKALKSRKNSFPEAVRLPHIRRLANRKQGKCAHETNEIKNSIQVAMSDHCSIIRSASGLGKCREILADAWSQLEDIRTKDSCLSAAYVEADHMIRAGLVITEHALKRTESTGAHYREDEQHNRLSPTGRPLQMI